MQFQINSKTFLSALNAVGRVVPAKAAIQILTNFLVEVKDNEISITASDTENHASVAVEAITDGQGKFCIDAKFLTDIIKNLPDCLVTVEVSDALNIVISTVKNTFKAVAQNGEQYPESDFNETATAEFKIPTEALLSGFTETSFAVGADDFHPQMMGVCFDIKPELVTFVATDTRRLAKSEYQVQTDVETRCILPSKTISSVSALAAKEREVNVTVYPTAVEFKGETFSLRSQLIKGIYPDYNRVIPQNNPIVVTFNRIEVLSSVKRVASCADSQFGVLRFSFNDNGVVISSNDAAFNRSAEETVDCESNGANIMIGLSSNLLISILSTLSADNVEFYISDPSRPIVLKSVGDDHITMLLMPMNIN